MPEIKFEYDEELVKKRLIMELNKYTKEERNDIKAKTGLDNQYINNMLQKGNSKQNISLPKDINIIGQVIVNKHFLI